MTTKVFYCFWLSKPGYRQPVYRIRHNEMRRQLDVLNFLCLLQRHHGSAIKDIKMQINVVVLFKFDFNDIFKRTLSYFYNQNLFHIRQFVACRPLPTINAYGIKSLNMKITKSYCDTINMSLTFIWRNL